MTLFYLFHKLKYFLVLLLCIPVVGTIGYWLIGNGKWSWFDCLYMTVISITTVGYGEMVDLNNHVLGRTFTMGLLLASSLLLAVIFARLGSAILEGELSDIRGKQKMKKTIDAMKEHIIIVGTNPVARQVIQELYDTRKQFVVVDEKQDGIDWLKTHFPNLIFQQVKTIDEDSLREAGLERAAGFVSVLDDERDNVFLTLTARQINSGIRIVSMCENNETMKKLKVVGANAVVRPTAIGGLRMVSELLRPSVVTFLDRMLRDSQKGLRFEEVTIGEHSKFNGKTLREAAIAQKTGLVIVAAVKDKDQITYNPPADFVLEAGTQIVVIGDSEHVKKLNMYLNGNGIFKHVSAA